MEFKLCTEFFLACLYFVIIFVINFFLYKLLNIYIKNIYELQKIKNILKIYPKNAFFTKLYKYSNKDFRNSITISNLQSLKPENIDTLVIGNMYKYFSATTKTNEKVSLLNDYYFQLLSNQYLSFKFNLK